MSAMAVVNLIGIIFSVITVGMASMCLVSFWKSVPRYRVHNILLLLIGLLLGILQYFWLLDNLNLS
jgi:uncharacterized membrane protein YqjE